MHVLALTDIHGRTGLFDEILGEEPAADLLVVGGDLTNFGRPADAIELIERARAHSEHVVAVAGNCDSQAIDRALSDAEVSVHAEGKRIRGYGVFGVSAMPPWRGNMYEFTEEEIDAYLSAGYEPIRNCGRSILVSHTPPRDTGVDETRTGSAVGSTAVRKHVEDVEPVLVISGHVHEAAGVSRLGPSTIVNCGPAKSGSYATISLSDTDGVEEVEHHRI